MRLAGCLLLGAMLVLSATGALSGPAHACGPRSDCVIGDGRYYRIRLPAGHDNTRPIGAIVFAHGYKSSGREAVESPGFAALGRSLGVAIIAAKSANDAWSLANAPSDAGAVDEVAYFDRVIDDATRRFAIDPKRIVATGFSAGGMMVWTLACERSGRYAGFVPIAGTFWHPVPESCNAAPGSVVHLHGDHDPVVPLEGRAIGKARQGVVRDAIAMYARHGGFGETTAVRRDGLRCENRTNWAGDLLNFCLYEGGHTFSLAHLRAAIGMLQAAGRF